MVANPIFDQQALTCVPHVFGVVVMMILVVAGVDPPAAFLHPLVGDVAMRLDVVGCCGRRACWQTNDSPTFVHSYQDLDMGILL